MLAGGTFEKKKKKEKKEFNYRTASFFFFSTEGISQGCNSNLKFNADLKMRGCFKLNSVNLLVAILNSNCVRSEEAVLFSKALSEIYLKLRHLMRRWWAWTRMLLLEES